ncbi:hypothetical protein MN032_06570 [Agromyces atrinae]|uniref:hypothetical protein n=1 Tax=Agromyces atrinae TaxID=592376 RepID=UPI001F594855|nr:hypothetical protein [Agromyces atrinae]MCI2957347.1 hypothetical protein [Agromyces atrinae]
MPDLLPVFGLALVIICVCAGCFAIAARGSRLGSWIGPWWVSLVGTIGTSTCYLLIALTLDDWWMFSLANGFMMLTITSYWSGARAYNGHPPLLWISIVAAVPLVASPLIWADEPPIWAGAPLRFGLLAVFSVLIAIEMLSLPLRRDRMSYLVAATVIAHGLYVSARLVVFLLEGPTSGIFERHFNTIATTLLNVGFVAVITVATIGILIARSHEDALGERVARVDLVPRSAFLRGANERANGERGALLVVAGVESFATLASALGRVRGDEVRKFLTAAVIDTLPAGSVVTTLRGDLVAAHAMLPRGTATSSIESTVTDLFRASAEEVGVPHAAAVCVARVVTGADVRPALDDATAAVRDRVRT